MKCNDCGGDGYLACDDWTRARASWPGECGPDERRVRCGRCDGTGDAPCVYCGTPGADAIGSDGPACAGCVSDD